MGGISVFVLLGILTSVFLIFVIATLIIGLYLLINYIFESIFLYKVNKEKHKIVAWIPFYNKYLLGKIADHKILGIVLSVIDIVNIILFMISYKFHSLPSNINTIIFFLIILLLILSFIFNIVLSHSIMKKITPKFVDVLTILNIFTLGFSRPIILFLMRNSKKLK